MVDRIAEGYQLKRPFLNRLSYLFCPEKIEFRFEHRLHVHVVAGQRVGLRHREVVPLVLAVETGTLFFRFSFIFVFFTIFPTNQCEKCPSSIRYWDSNPRPISSRIT